MKSIMMFNRSHCYLRFEKFKFVSVLYYASLAVTIYKCFEKTIIQEEMFLIASVAKIVLFDFKMLSSLIHLERNAKT